MSGAITAVPWRDENRSLFVGGMDFFDLSGTGVGPWVPLGVILGADGTSILKVNADGSINTSGSSVVTPVGAGTATNKSFTTDGSAHTQIAANVSRLGWQINNPLASALNANADPIYIRLGATAAADGTSFEVPAGQSFPPGGFPLYTGLVSVIGATGIKCPAVELSA